MTRPALVEIENLSVRFGGVQALKDISLAVRQGATCGIIGPNGAGKTTLFNCISGFIRPEPGSRVLFDGADVLGRRVDQVANLGIARTFQNIALNPGRTVRENILTGLHLTLDYGPFGAMLGLGRVRRAEANAHRVIDEVADLLGLSQQVLQTQVDSLSLGLQKKVEVARVLVRRPRLLLLDEPAGGLNDGETRDLARSIRRLSEGGDLTIILIDHDMGFVMPLCDQVCVLNFGQLVADGPPGEIAANQDVIACYLGVSDDA